MILNNRVVLIDYMNVVHASFNIAKRIILQEKQQKGEEPLFLENNIPFFYNVFFNKINKIFYTYGRAIVCEEGYNSLEWRRSIFPDYKRNRDKQKIEDDYILFKNSLANLDEVVSYFPTKILKVDEAEADDIIYVLSEKYSNLGKEVIIVSSDNDLSQIMNNFSNVRIYNHIKNEYMKPKKNILLEKAIIGDRSDNIPGLQRIGEKTLEKMMNDKNFFKEKMKDGNKEIVETFLKIIDLRNIPTTVKQKILDKDEKTRYNTFDNNEIEAFLFNNRMLEMLENWSNVYNKIYRVLKENDDEN